MTTVISRSGQYLGNVVEYAFTALLYGSAKAACGQTTRQVGGIVCHDYEARSRTENRDTRYEIPHTQLSRSGGCFGFFALVGGALADFDFHFASIGVVTARFRTWMERHWSAMTETTATTPQAPPKLHALVGEVIE